MRKFQILALSILALVLTSCDTDISINTMNLKVVNNNELVQVGEDLNLDIKVKDTDGIDFIIIEIPVLNISERIDDYSSDNKWKLSKSYTVTDVTQTGKYEILLYLTDRAGVEYLEEEEFRIR
jgi:hypothetical protein